MNKKLDPKILKASMRESRLNWAKLYWNTFCEILNLPIMWSQPYEIKAHLAMVRELNDYLKGSENEHAGSPKAS